MLADWGSSGARGALLAKAKFMKDTEEMEELRLERLRGREAGFSDWRDWGGASLRRS